MSGTTRLDGIVACVAPLLRRLRAVVEPPPPVDLKAPGDRASRADAAWDDARGGWGRVARNSFWFDDQFRAGVFLKLGGADP